MWSKTHILVLFICSASLFLHSEGVPLPVDPTLKSVCKATRFPQECVSFLNSRILGGKVDALSALKEYIEGAIAAFEDAEAMAVTKVCKASYTNVLSKLKGTKQCVADRNSFDLIALLSGAASDADTCAKDLRKLPKVNPREVEDSAYLSEIITNTWSLAEQFDKTTKPAVKNFSVSRPKPTFGKRSVSRPKPTFGKRSVSRPKPTSGKRSVSRPKPTFGKRSVARSRPAATPVDAGLTSICNQTMYPDVCVSTIAPLLKRGKVDAVSALKAEMQAALVPFQQTLQITDKAVAGGALEMIACQDMIGIAVDFLLEAQQAVSVSNKSVDLEHVLGAVNTDVRACREDLSEGESYGGKSAIPAETLALLEKLSQNCYDILKQIH